MSTSLGTAITTAVTDSDQNVPHEAVQLEDVLDEEQKQIQEIRDRRGARSQAENYSIQRKRAIAPDPAIPGRPSNDIKPKWQTSNDRTYPKWRQMIKTAHEKNYVGLAFSGGGIRSATFNLGVLQALAALKLLFRVDYLSTVSGGGYIGGWLTAWTKRQADFKDVQENLAKRELTSFGYTQTELEPNRVHQEDDKEPPPIRFLRVFSNYLTPKLGLLSGDTWTTVAIYLRNLLLNLVIVLALVTTLLLVPRVVQRSAYALQGAGEISHVLIVVVLGFSLLIAFVMILANMADLDSRDRKVKPYTRQRYVLIGVGVPLFAAAVTAALWLANRPNETKRMSYGETAAIGACLYGAIWLLATAVTYRKWISRIEARVVNLAKTITRRSKHDKAMGNAVPSATRFSQNLRRIGEILRQSATLLVSVVAAVAAGALAGGLYGCLLGWVQGGEVTGQVTKALTWCVPAIVGIFVLAGVLHIGLMGITFESWKREWWGRLGGWLLLFATAWLVIFWVALCFRDAVWTGSVVKAAWKWIAGALTPAWVFPKPHQADSGAVDHAPSPDYGKLDAEGSFRFADSEIPI
jgi:hypothetical protein